MIPPCRIHRIRSHIDSLPFAFLFAVFLLIPHNEAMGQYGAGGSTSGSGGEGVPLEITSGVDFGYDDHVIGSNAATSSNSPSSFFTKENLVLTYDRPGERTEFRLLAVGRFTQFIDVGTEDKDLSVTASLTHRFTTRLSFNAEIYGAYQTEPDFQSNVGPTNVRAPHFDTNDVFSLTYHWLPRLATVTSYTFQRIKYESSSVSSSPSSAAIGAAQDRFQNTLAERLQYSLTSRTSFTGEYRFEVIDYDTAPRDATIHFALGGLEHSLTEHLLINLLGGPSFRFFKNDGSTINPFAEVKIDYHGANHSLSWITTYGVEQPSQTLAAGATTLRSGLNLAYDLTPRITLKAGAYYHHEENQKGGGGAAVTTSTSSQDSLHFNLGLKYTINKHFALHADYEYTNQTSSGGTSAAGGASGYSRNRYFAGVTYTY
jgi:putative salt-induced outer membrane protein YdiY